MMRGLAALAPADERAENRGRPNSVVANRVARIVSISGSQAIALRDRSSDDRIEIGALMKIRTPRSQVMGLVSAISCPLPDTGSDAENLELIEINLAGEIAADTATGGLVFHRGVAHLPSVGDAVSFASREDLELVYFRPHAATIDVGHLRQNPDVPARLLVDDLLAKHFLVVGTTGSGKSSAISCILQGLLEEHPYAHVVILDVHNEYASTFGARAEIIDPINLRLPFWLMNFEELTTAFTGDDENRNEEAEVLAEAVLAAKRRYSDARSSRLRKATDGASIRVDTPAPFRLSDLTAFIDERLGRLEKTQNVLPLRRLKNRIETLVSDPRFAFMFGSLVIEDTMGAILGRIFRIPIEGRPITVLNLSSVPAEVLDIVISVISRLAFDLGVWSEGAMPMLIVCEEAHRYAPPGTVGKFMPTRKALAQIAREGRKYGVSLALVTQRPSELDPAILSQCSTIIAMRLSTERDHQVIRANSHEGAVDLLDFLPLLGEREAIVLGQGVIMPMRIKFRDLGASKGALGQRKSFSAAWKDPKASLATLDEVVRSWRSASKSGLEE